MVPGSERTTALKGCDANPNCSDVPPECSGLPCSQRICPAGLGAGGWGLGVGRRTVKPTALHCREPFSLPRPSWPTTLNVSKSKFLQPTDSQHWNSELLSCTKSASGGGSVGSGRRRHPLCQERDSIEKQRLQADQDTQDELSWK